MKISNEELYKLCKKYGAEARLARQKFIGLLPEVNKRRLYEEKGFSSIFEFAAKLCGLSAEQVRLTLNLEKRFEDKPVLKKMLETGEASINKLTRIASIATPENRVAPCGAHYLVAALRRCLEEELAEKIKMLPVSALNTLVRDEKQNGSAKPLFEDKVVYVQTSDNGEANPQSTSLSFELADDITEQLNGLHAKGLDVNQLLRKLLQQRREKIAEEKQEISENITITKSRYIPIKIKKILHQEYGEKCSIEICAKPAEAMHHTQRFSLGQNHNPKFLAPLCRDHHTIAHSIDIKFQEARPIG